MKIGRFLVYSTGIATTSSIAASLFYFYANNKRSCVPEGTKYSISLPRTRDQMLQKLKNEKYDILIIGGGATGSGVALDAASRGLNCAVVEMGDISSGASGRSSKLIHGQSLYLNYFFGGKLSLSFLPVMIETMQEKVHDFKSAPFMTNVVPLIIPVYGYFEAFYYFCMMKILTMLNSIVCSFDTAVPGSTYMDRNTTKLALPPLEGADINGSIVIYDGMHNDARRNLLIALSASLDNYIEGQKGATIANYTEVTDLIKDQNGTIIGAYVLDRLSKEKFPISAKVVVNCTGAYTDVVRRMSDVTCKELVLPSGGVHIALPKWYCNNGFGLHRDILLLPWENRCISGGTYLNQVPHEHPVANQVKIDEVISRLATALSFDADIIRGNVLSTFSGLRPMMRIQTESGLLPDKRRPHVLDFDSNGLATITGGKWTTYRKMAEDVLDKLLEKNKGILSTTRNCRTKNMLLLGSTDHTNTYEMKEAMYGSGMLPLKLAKKYPELTQNQAEHLVRNYGFRSLEVCQLGSEEGLLKPLVHDLPFLKAEVIYGIRNEMACFPSDIIGRRMSLAYSDNEKAKAALPEVVDLMAKELNWSPEKIAIARDEGNAFIQTTRVDNLESR